MHTKKKLSISQQFFLALGALGVVYGDIGTSPLYALKEIFFGHSHLDLTPNNILGIMSLVFWVLTIIVTFKYVTFVLRADNEGEGGVFALYSLLEKKKVPAAHILGGMLILASGLLFGEGLITPAISVISAIEGLTVITAAFEAYVVPITIVILTGLFFIQSFGTDKIGKLFGPITALWFIVIAVVGFFHLLNTPEVLAAINPIYAVQFIREISFHKLLIILGSVVLVVTGGEALFADMGHFGRLPIRLSWLALTYPALLLNYFGQAAYLLSGQPVVNESIFFSMIPSWGLLPMIILATLATIIASQALITGAYSLASQAVALGLLPLLKIKYTHEEHAGQIYMPAINWLLYIGCISLVLIFKTSSNLAAAYGLAVSGVMLATSLSMIQICQRYWNWKPWLAYSIFGTFVLIDGLFLMANSLKIFQGGYVPLLIGLCILAVMKTWQWGRKMVAAKYSEIKSMTLSELVKIKKAQVDFLPRSIVIMTPEMIVKKTDKVPFLEQIFWERYGKLPLHLVFVNISMENDPYCADERFEVTNFYSDSVKGSIQSVKIKFGFMEEPNVENVLEDLAAHEKITISDHPDEWLIHIAQERIYKAPGMGWWYGLKYAFFALLLKNAQTFDQYFELGKNVELTVETIPVKFNGQKIR